MENPHSTDVISDIQRKNIGFGSGSGLGSASKLSFLYQDLPGPGNYLQISPQVFKKVN